MVRLFARHVFLRFLQRCVFRVFKFLSFRSLALSTVGSAKVACGQKPLLVRVAQRAMRCRYLSPPDVDVSVLVGERTLHHLASRPASVLTLSWPVGLVRVELGKVHRRALPLSYGHPFNGPGPLCTATRTCVGGAVLAPSCRCRFAPWCEASDTDLVGGPCFRKHTAEARVGRSTLPSQELLKVLHGVRTAPLNPRNSSDSAALSACKAQTEAGDFLANATVHRGVHACWTPAQAYATAAAPGFGALVRSPYVLLAAYKTFTFRARPSC